MTDRIDPHRVEDAASGTAVQANRFEQLAESNALLREQVRQLIARVERLEVQRPVSNGQASDQRPASNSEELVEIKALLHELRALIIAQKAAAPKPTAPPDLAADRNFYYVHEFATLVHRKPYTVREWCRLGRLRCPEKPSRNQPWKIPKEELDRYRRDTDVSPPE